MGFKGLVLSDPKKRQTKLCPTQPPATFPGKDRASGRSHYSGSPGGSVDPLKPITSERASTLDLSVSKQEGASRHRAHLGGSGGVGGDVGEGQRGGHERIKNKH